jgi:hypothetical protein
MYFLFSVIGGTSFWVVHEHERNTRIALLLEFLLVIVGTAAIVNRLSPVLGAGFYP